MNAAPPSASPATAKPRRPRYPATVKQVKRLTPRMVRVTFTGEELGNFEWNGPAAHIKVMFTADMPTEDGPRPTMRTYTPRRFDAATRELDVDFVMHGEGPASTWAEQAAPGQRLIIAGPGRNYPVDATADWFVLAGDDSALPAIATILEVLPPTAKALVLLEVADQNERHTFNSAANVAVTWLYRSAATEPGQPLEAALHHIELPQGSGYIYVGCESSAMRRIRRYLSQERHVDRARLVTRGYWKVGQTDHPDGDYGQDVDG